MKINKLKSAMLLASAHVLLIHSHSAIADFSGDYDPSNWVLSNTNSGDGWVYTADAPASITLYGTDNGANGAWTSYTTTLTNCAAGCTVSFDWEYLGTDNGWDDAYYLVDGDATWLADTYGANGSVELLDVPDNTDFGWAVSTVDGIFGEGILYISGFLVIPNYSLEDAMESLIATNAGISSTISSMNLAVNGAHSRPMSRRVATNMKTFWVAGDFARDNHGSKDGKAAVAEVGLGYNYGPAQVNLSLGKTWSDQDLINNGEIDADGKFLMLEGIIPVSGVENLYATLGAYGHWGDIDARRGYLNGDILESSGGDTDSRSWGLRARLDWENAFAANSMKFSPYADLWHNETSIDSYTESGGSFPASYDKRDENVTDLRLGLNGAAPIPNSDMNFVLNVEVAHRFNNDGASVSGDLIGIDTFDLNGKKHEQNWFKGGIGVEGSVGNGKLSVMLNGTTESEMPNAWIAASWQATF